MIETLRVTAVERALIGTTECWAVHQERPDGTTHLHVFPADTLTWRAAEYGIDPADTTTLLDIVLHEPHLTDPDTYDPPAAQALRQRAGHTAPVTLATARSRDEARQAHLARIEYTKATRTHVVSGGPAGRAAAGGDPLDIIRRHTVHPDRAREIHAAIHGDLPAHATTIRRNRLPEVR